MNFLRNWREYIPTGERLHLFLAIGVIVAVTLGNILFIGSFIVPQWQVRSELASQLVGVEQQLAEAKREREKSPEQLKEQLATAQTELDQTAGAFFNESEAAEILNKLYQYANESGVEIITLQNQPGPEQKEKAVYDVNTFQLQAIGAVPNLITFVSKIKEAARKSFVITEMNIVEREGQHTLMLGITLYTSPYSSDVDTEPLPKVTPPPTSTNLSQLEEALEAAWASSDWERAISLLPKIIAIDLDYAGIEGKLYTAYVNYGYQLLERGDTGWATTQFNLALEIEPNGEEALAGLQQAVATPTPTLTAEEQLAQRLDEAWEAEDWEEAMSVIEQILAINPDDADMTEKLYAARVNYGHALAAEGKLEEAKEAFTDALDIKPDGAEAKAGLQALAAGTLPSTPTPEFQYIIHVVQRGENLFRIALRYGATVEAIMAANGLTNHNIYVGQQLRIPVH